MYKYHTRSNSFHFHICIGNAVSKAFYIQVNIAESNKHQENTRKKIKNIYRTPLLNGCFLKIKHPKLGILKTLYVEYHYLLHCFIFI